MSSKQIKVTDSSLQDRISDLPSNIIDRILGRTPIRDVVATCILSKEWRHKWKTVPNLIFDIKFLEDAARYRDDSYQLPLKHEYGNIIGKILLLHSGPIEQFFLHMPYYCNNLRFDLISWMHFLSQKEVKALTIHAGNAQFKLPSYIFHCSELRILKIQVQVIDLYPPDDFKGFFKLLSLDMVGFVDGTQISNLVSKCPLLQKLSLNHVAEGHTLVIDAPRLVSFCTSCSPNTSLKLKNVHNVTDISLRFGKLGIMRLCDLFDIFGSAPNVVTVSLCTLRTISDMPSDAPMSLPTTLHSHKSLTVLKIDISSPQCIYFLLCILKSSPTLQNLNLEIYPRAYIREEAALRYLDTQLKEPQTMKSLSTVKIKGLLGTKVEMMFIKLILSCSPVLETMYLAGDHMVSEAEFTLMSEMLKCKRSSSQAQVIYSRPPQDNSIFNF